MSERLLIQSYRGPYEVLFDEEVLTRLNAEVPPQAHFIIDARVAELYARELDRVLNSPSVLQIEALEQNKTLDKFTGYVEYLVSNGVKRSHTLVAIGGGIMQDITCFLAATLLRGLPWFFYPTTLLAQADSCIGSKSSINVGKTKNVLGTFTPPQKIFLTTRVLATLEDRELRSGLGEMLKVHAIAGPEAFDEIAADYSRIMTDAGLMQHYIQRSLNIKKVLIELDEFDQGPRNIMNYGHSFGHAIEAATNFLIPHGIAVSLGMDLANHLAVRLGLTDERHYHRMHPALATNYAGFKDVVIDLAAFLEALGKDKKNVDAQLRLVLPDSQARLTVGSYPNNAFFQETCRDYFGVYRCR